MMDDGILYCIVLHRATLYRTSFTCRINWYWDNYRPLSVLVSMWICKLRSVTHGPGGSGAINRLQNICLRFLTRLSCKYTTGFVWYTRFWHRLEFCSFSSQKLACTWLKWLFMIRRRLLLIFCHFL